MSMNDQKSSNQMWGGRFASGPDAIMEEINASIDFDRKLYAQDIQGSLAHAAMLAKTGIITAEDHQKIEQGLKTILTAIEKIKSGISICIFPEGTRNKNKDELELLPFHEGSFKIASKSGCAIIPMAMNNTAEIFEAHMPKIKSTHVVLEYGKPIYVKELSKEDQKHLGTYTQNIIYEMLEKNKSLV